ncbi:TolC family protein [Gemmatimonas sp. UBA7669]|uniref:TolC family protein n=1 Tax=Gemmatimonas sp. UBA7669 TaxID=1946568 RepID=UPI0025C72BA4|nr:TolC family protein [Gemmatimonas sp. UBA7669]
MKPSVSLSVATLLFVAAGMPLAAQARQPVVLTLGQAARLAAEQSGGVAVARTRVAQSEARALQRRGALIPDLAAGVAQSERTLNSATFGFSFANPVTGQPLLRPDGELIGPVPTVDLRYRVQAPLVDLGRFASWRAAQAATGAVSAEVEVQADAAAAVAAAVYVRAARADAQVEARVADSVLAADLLRIARDQLAAGVGIALDVTRAQSQLAAVRAQLIVARNERDRTVLELKRATGLPLDGRLTLGDSLAGLPREDGAVLRAMTADEPALAASVREALSGRADLRALGAQERAQREAARAIRWERTPQLGLVVDHGVLGRNWERLLPTYSWGVQLSVGLFDGFRREARLEEQVALARETDTRLRDLREQGALEVRAALLDLASAAEQLDAVQERLALAEQEVQQARDRFEAGVAGNGDVIAALLSLNQARTLRIDALAAYQQARVNRSKAIGSIRQLQ